jgi:hypothetical protein
VDAASQVRAVSAVSRRGESRCLPVIVRAKKRPTG